MADEITSAQVRRLQEIAELKERIKETEGSQKELLEAQLELLEALQEGDEKTAKKAAETLGTLKGQLKVQEEQVKAQEELNKKLSAATELGKQIGDRFFGLHSTIARAVIEAGSLEAAIGQTAAKIDESARKTGFAMASIDKLINNTKDLVLALDQQQAAFVQNTGASREFAANAFRTRSELAFLGITGNDAVETMGKLYSQMSEFSQLSQASQRDFVALSAQIEKLGGNAGEMGQVFTKVANMDISQTGMAMQRVAGIADAVGIPLSQLSSDIAGMGELFAKMGDQGLDTFAGLTAAAKETGLSVQELYGIVGQYDDFNNAAAAAGRLNMVLGGNLIDTYSLLAATEEERVALLQQTLEASGRTFEEMDRFERLEIASALNIPLEQAAQLFNTTSGEVRKTAAEIMYANMTSEELAQRTQDAATAQEKLNVLIGNFAILIAPAVEYLNKFVDGFIGFTESVTGGNGVAAAILTVVGGLGALRLGAFLTAKVFGFSVSSMAASVAASAPAAAGGLSTIGAAAGGAAVGVGSLVLAVAGIGAGIGIAAAGFGYLIDKIGSFSNSLTGALEALGAIFSIANVGSVAGEVAGGIREITSALNEMPDDQTKALTFATTADALANLTNAASTIEEAKLASMAALVQAMTNAEGDNGVGQLANAIQNLITSNAEGREATIELDGYNLGRWIDRRETRNARVVLSGQNG
jgi:hypothetical protein